MCDAFGPQAGIITKMQKPGQRDYAKAAKQGETKQNKTKQNARQMLLLVHEAFGNLYNAMHVMCMCTVCHKFVIGVRDTSIKRQSFIDLLFVGV